MGEIEMFLTALTVFISMAALGVGLIILEEAVNWWRDHL